MTIADVLVNMVTDGLAEIAKGWLDGEEFSVAYLTTTVSNDDARPEDIECIKDALSDVARDYGLEISYSGRMNDTAKFTVKAEATREPLFFTC